MLIPTASYVDLVSISAPAGTYAVSGFINLSNSGSTFVQGVVNCNVHNSAGVLASVTVSVNQDDAQMSVVSTVQNGATASVTLSCRNLGTTTLRAGNFQNTDPAYSLTLREAMITQQ